MTNTTTKRKPSITPFQTALRDLGACQRGRRYVGRRTLREFWARSLREDPIRELASSAYCPAAYRSWLCDEVGWWLGCADGLGGSDALEVGRRKMGSRSDERRPPFTMAQVRKAAAARVSWCRRNDV